jgi:hypothetical protein
VDRAKRDDAVVPGTISEIRVNEGDDGRVLGRRDGYAGPARHRTRIGDHFSRWKSGAPPTRDGLSVHFDRAEAVTPPQRGQVMYVVTAKETGR